MDPTNDAGALPPGTTTYKVGGGVTAPVVVSKKDPEYTEVARAAKYQGTVLLYVEIGPDGMAHNTRVVRSLGLGLDEKAIEAVAQWQFKPGTKDGQPVTVAATIEVNFRLL
jgi:TonB family protein